MTCACSTSSLLRWRTRSSTRCRVGSCAASSDGCGTGRGPPTRSSSIGRVRRASGLAPRSAREVRHLLSLDVDAQRTNPLSVVRSAVRYPTEVLRSAGVPPVRRDEFAERAFPDDIYDLSPASFADVDPSLHEPGVVWGAAKAHIHLTRHRRPPP